MEDKLNQEIHIINGRYVLVEKTIVKTLHPDEARGLVKMYGVTDKTGTIDS